MILSIDLEKRRISFGLKPSYFADSDFDQDEDDDESEEDDNPDEALGVVDSESDEDEADGGVTDEEAYGDQGVSSAGEESELEPEQGVIDVDMNIVPADREQAAQTKTKPTSSITLSLDVKQGFQWSVDSSTESDAGISSSDDDEGGQERKKKRKRKAIEHDLTADMHTKTPDSNADFERVLLGSPNSSYLWIQYMSFQLQISEVDKAREIAKRALRTISFREEQEKLNVWIALLNLENVYGTEESLETAFKDAARHNDSKTIHLRMAAIFDQSGKPEVCYVFPRPLPLYSYTQQKAEEQYKRTCKKFGYSSKVWTLFGEHYLKRGKLEDARKLLPRSLQSLEKRKREFLVSSILMHLSHPRASQISRPFRSLHNSSTSWATRSVAKQFSRALSIPIPSDGTCGLSTSTWKQGKAIF